MRIIQITNTYKDEVLNIVRSCVPEGFEIRTLPENTGCALAQCIDDADYLLASGRIRIDATVLSSAKKLKMVQRTGVGLDAIDLQELAKRDIPLYVNYGVNAGSVAEHAILLMLSCLRKLPQISQNTKSGKWIKQAQGVTTRELRCCSVGVIGMGNIGRNVARLLQAFGSKVYYYDAYRLSSDMEKKLGITYLPCDELMRNADIITMHCALTDQNKGLICQESIQTMKDGVIIVNTARGALINENDLIVALENGKVGYAGLDVFETEPPQNRELLEHPRVIATPHIAGITYDSFYQMMSEAMRNISAFDQGDLQAIEQYRVKIGD